MNFSIPFHALGWILLTFSALAATTPSFADCSDESDREIEVCDEEQEVPQRGGVPLKGALLPISLGLEFGSENINGSKTDDLRLHRGAYGMLYTELFTDRTVSLLLKWGGGEFKGLPSSKAHPESNEFVLSHLGIMTYRVGPALNVPLTNLGNGRVEAQGSGGLQHVHYAASIYDTNSWEKSDHGVTNGVWADVKVRLVTSHHITLGYGLGYSTFAMALPNTTGGEAFQYQSQTNALEAALMF